MAWVNIKSLKNVYNLKKKNHKNAKNAKNRGSFLPSPVPTLNKGTGEGPKITEYSAERSAEQGMFGLSLVQTWFYKNEGYILFASNFMYINR